jgi:phosphopantothenoylcysteine decarboxylase/phosphopantothenate--cysteine ligase
MQLTGKRILLGITGSIAAYKTPLLARLLVKEGAEVKVVMSSSAADFVTPHTLAVITRHPVYSSFYTTDGTWINHVELAYWADLMVIAPASVHTMAKMACGLCDNLLMATYMAARCPVMIVPAMDAEMFNHPSTLANIKKLQSFNHMFIGPAVGELASGLHGPGRMEEPEFIFGKIILHFTAGKDFAGKQVLITCGPTREAIDPVRYISNRSSGKMGLALAQAFVNRGASIMLIAGPGVQIPEHLKGRYLQVESAREMHRACMKWFPQADIVIMAAAVADYTMAQPQKEKINRTEKRSLLLRLSPTPDILAEMGKKKKKNQFLVGFALESGQGLQNALRKLENKNLDLIVLNSLRDEGAGFETDTNKVTLIGRDRKKILLPLKSKMEVANEIADYIKKKIHP